MTGFDFQWGNDEMNTNWHAGCKPPDRTFLTSIGYRFPNRPEISWFLYEDNKTLRIIIYDSWFQSPGIMDSGRAQLYPVDVYIVSVAVGLAGVCAVTKAYSNLLYSGQIYAAITERSEGYVPLAP